MGLQGVLISSQIHVMILLWDPSLRLVKPGSLESVKQSSKKCPSTNTFSCACVSLRDLMFCQGLQ